MSDETENIRGMVVELIQAMTQYPYREEEIDEILNALPGIMDGSFFERPLEEQRDGLGWVGGAFFGRGERAIPLLKEGFLRHEFPSEFLRHSTNYFWGVDEKRNS